MSTDAIQTTGIIEMSLEKEDVRLKLDPCMKQRLEDIAAFNGMEQNKQLTLLVEKALVGEHHFVTMALERIKRNERLRDGAVIVGQDREGQGNLKVVQK